RGLSRGPPRRSEELVRVERLDVDHAQARQGRVERAHRVLQVEELDPGDAAQLVGEELLEAHDPGASARRGREVGELGGEVGVVADEEMSTTLPSPRSMIGWKPRAVSAWTNGMGISPSMARKNRPLTGWSQRSSR
ncbi:hypothetical protein, partial [Streptococcus pneumoniae]|uniref:hypothetical protein n=1 Tax=Streptococcus pneumoniae TaxID=1313 RepID=UPI000ACF0752